LDEFTEAEKSRCVDLMFQDSRCDC